MNPTPAFWMVFREFFKAMRDPQAHHERTQTEAQAYQDHILKVSERLRISPKPKEEIRHFRTLVEALDFVATCLETDAVAGLAEEMEGLEGLLEMDPGWPCHFREYFFAVKEIHLRKDLRRLNADKEFPEMTNDSSWAVCSITWNTRQSGSSRDTAAGCSPTS